MPQIDQNHTVAIKTKYTRGSCFMSRNMLAIERCCLTLAAAHMPTTLRTNAPYTFPGCDSETIKKYLSYCFKKISPRRSRNPHIPTESKMAISST